MFASLFVESKPGARDFFDPLSSWFGIVFPSGHSPNFWKVFHYAVGTDAVTYQCVQGRFIRFVEATPETQRIGPEAISGQWITNQGVLDLSIEGEALSGTLNEKTKVSGECSIRFWCTSKDFIGPECLVDFAGLRNKESCGIHGHEGRTQWIAAKRR